jgi:Uma2 family endonuclease
MSALPDRPIMTVEEYLELDRKSEKIRYEYIDGQLRMLAGGSLNHSMISLNIAVALRSQLHGRSCRVYNSDARVNLSKTRYVYPDVTVTCDGRDRGVHDTIRSPRVVFEILSPSTEDYNRGRKFTYYRDVPTIQEYVLVASDCQFIEVYRRASERLWIIHTFGQDEFVELASLGVRFSVASAYEDVKFGNNSFLPDDDEPA